MAETQDGTGKDEKAAVVAAIEPTITAPSKVKNKKIICFKKEQKKFQSHAGGQKTKGNSFFQCFIMLTVSNFF